MKKHIILLDRATPEERSAVHVAIKEEASGWWHHFEDTWIVSGQTSKHWRDLVQNVLTSPGSAVLVLALPEEGMGRGWAYYGPKASEKMKWLHQNYFGKK